MINLPVADRSSIQRLQDDKILAHVKAVEQALNGHGRVILRPSGTEPLIRITVEGPQQEIVVQLAEQLATEVSSSLAQ